MAGTNGPKMPLIDCDHDLGSQPLGQGHNRSIDSTEREIGVLQHQISDPLPIIRMRRLHIKAGQAPQEGRLGGGPQSFSQQVASLCDRQGRNHQVEVSPL